MYTSPTSATMITSPLLAKQLKVAAVSDSEPESYLLDHLKFMKTQEKQYQVQGDYLLSSHCIVTTTDRRTMCDWSYTIVDACNIEREMSCIGISYFDRFMSTASIIGGGSKVATEALHSRRTFQLVYIACLVIALKCRGGMQVDANFVSETICRNQYESDEINDMECEVLRALTWKLNGPSPHEFVDGIIQLLPSMKKEDDDKEEDADESLMMKTLTKLAKTRVEESLLDHRSMNKTSSSIAFAALLSALQETRVVEALNPLNVMTWMSRIGQVCWGTSETMRNVFGLIEGLGDMMKSQPFLRTVSSLSRARSISSEEEDNDYEHSNTRRPLKYSTLKRRYEDLYHHTYGEQSMYSCDTISSSEHRQQRARSFLPKFRRTQSDGSSSSATFTRGCLFGSSFDSIGSL